MDSALSSLHMGVFPDLSCGILFLSKDIHELETTSGSAMILIIYATHMYITDL